MTAGPHLPAWITGIGLVFWGISTDAYWLGIPFAVLVLAPGFVQRRFEFSSTEYHRALDICWVLFFGALLLVYSREPMGNVLRSFSRWLPAVFFPALMAQTWSVRNTLPITALLSLPWWRRNADPARVIDLQAPFLALSVLSACVTVNGGAWFFTFLVAMVGLALWSVRPSRGSAPAAALSLAVALGGGWFLSSGVADIQQRVEARLLAWVSRWRGEENRGRTATTAIGQNGNVGGGSRIVMRVRNPLRGDPPGHFSLGTYSAWRGSSWVALQPEREKVEGLADEWQLDDRPGRIGSAVVEWVPELTQGFLPLPEGTRVIGELSADRVERTRLGAVWAQTRAGLVSYRADHALDAAWEGAPLEEDRSDLPPKESAAIGALVQELDLAGRPPEEVLRRIEKHFQSNFKYTTDLRDLPLADVRALTPLGRFLLGSKTGHCEFFATAAVLMLRQCHIPARYTRGFLVSAAEQQGDVVTVRQREAHAWARVWIDGRWRDFDPTPSEDLGAVLHAENWLGRFGRVWNDLRFAVMRWWWLGEKTLLRRAYWLALPLLAWLIWRFRKVREAASSLPVDATPASPTARSGLDSEWFQVEPLLIEAGWTRLPGEPWSRCHERLALDGWPSPLLVTVRSALELHLRLRFDPAGLAKEDRSELSRLAGQLLVDVPAQPPRPSSV